MQFITPYGLSHQSITHCTCVTPVPLQFSAKGWDMAGLYPDMELTGEVDASGSNVARCKICCEACLLKGIRPPETVVARRDTIKRHFEGDLRKVAVDRIIQMVRAAVNSGQLSAAERQAEVAKVTARQTIIRGPDPKKPQPGLALVLWS